MQRSQCEKENVQLVQELAEVDGPFESPINLNFRDLIKLELPSLTWNKPDSIPKKMKITNTGHTVIVSGKWKCERPYLTGGPLDGKYVFSQIHFHWGPDNTKGSEHQVCGESFPLEMHVAHFKTEYMTQEAALREKDGMVVLVYLFKLQEEPNNSLKKIISALPYIKQANTSQPLESRSILSICNPFTDDYFMYWGSVVTSSCAHILLWIVCREPFGISKDQMEEFRKILDSSHHPIKRNSREPQPLHKRNVFHVNASRHMDEPMLPIKKIFGCFCLEESKNAEGDGSGCNCASSSGPQEELEGRQGFVSKRDCGISKGNGGVYLQQTVYYQHETVHSVPALSKRFTDPLEVTEEKDSYANTREVSQSCCFLSAEEKSASDETYSRDRVKERRIAIDSVTTLANLIDTLETLKIQTYKKLKEIESINQEIRGMRASCENIEEKHWLHHAEKIMSRQKRFTIRSSQCCFSELKKLAKECNFDKLLDDSVISEAEDGKTLFMKTADAPLSCSIASGDKLEFGGWERIASKLSVSNSERFSRKAQKLIRSFFEDIKESEETQLNVEKSLLLKKFEKLSKRKSTLMNTSSLNFPQGQMLITKKMMNLGQIRKQFFTEIAVDEKTVTPMETKMVPAGKKKNKGFFKVSLSAFDSDKKSTAKKATKGSFFTKSALAWINNRINTLHDTSPVIPLRITDIELKTGSIITKNKSKQSVKTTSIRKLVSDEHARTEVSSYLSESIISGFSDKQSRYSKQNRAQRSIIQGVENNIDTNGEVSIVRVVEDRDTNSFFVRLSNSANISSGTTIDSDRRKGRKSRKDLWEDCSSTISEYQRDITGKREVHYKRTEHVQCRNSLTRHIVQRILSTSSESSIVIGQQSKREMLTLISNKTTKEMVSSRDVSIGATENFSEDSPRKKRMKLESMTSSLDVDEVCYTEPEYQKVRYTENECQVDIMPTVPAFETTAVQCQETDIQKVDVGKFEVKTREELQNIVLESRAETDNDSSESHYRVTLLDTPAEAHVTLPVLVENEAGEDESKTGEDNVDESGTSAVSVSPEKSQDKMSEPDKDLALDPENNDPRESVQAPEDTAILGSETNAVSDKLILDAKNAIHRETHKNDKPAETVYNLPSIQNFADEDSPQHDIHCENFSHLLSDEQSEKKMKILGDGVEDSEYNDEKRHRSAVSLSRDIFHDMSKDISRFTSQDVSQNELSECNDYDLQTDSNGTMHYIQQQCLPSGETTPSTPSSDNEKQEELSIATGSSLVRINSQRKQFSTESFNIYRSSNEGKHKKRRSCVKKKSKHLVRRNNSVIKRLNRVGSNFLDFTNLTEEEQLKIISANVANFVKQKLVEHKQFFDFEKNDPMVFGMEHWSKVEEDDANVLSETIGEAEGNVFDLENESSPPLESMLRTEREQQSAPVDKLAPAEPTPQDEAPAVPDPVAEQPTSQTEEKVKKESESLPNNPEVTENQTANEIQGAKADSNKQSLDFIKLNKMMASKYKRAGPEADKGAAGKKTVKKEAKKEAIKPPTKPTSAQKDTVTPLQSSNVPSAAPSENQEPESNSKPDNPKTVFTPRRGIRAPSADSAKGITRGMKSDIPVLQPREHSTSPRRVGRVNVRSVSASPATAKTVPEPRKIPSPPLAPPKKVLPKKRLIPTYTLTSCLTTPNELIRYQQRELDKYLNQRGDITNFLEESTKRPRKKNRNALSKKNLDYLIMLQKRINHEISENIENSMNYVKTLLSQDYNGTAIIEKAPVKNSLDDFEAQNGILLIEMNDRMDSSSSSSELSNESGFYCLYRSNDTWEKDNSKPDIIVKRNESGDSGMVEELQNMDSSYDCEVSIVVNPGNESSEQEKHCTSNILKKYIYHLGGGEESSDVEVAEASLNPKPKQKRRKERVLDIPQEMKRKLLDILEDEMKHPPPAEDPSSSSSSSSSAVLEECLESKEENFDLENSEIISKISEVVLQYLDEQDWKHSPEDGEAKDQDKGTDHDKKLPDTESR